MKILIAEDDLTSRLMLTAFLKAAGYEPLALETGQAAWELLQQPDAPRLVLLDWEMPGLDGLEVCRRVRQLNSSDPAYIILLTARGKKGDIVQGLEAGANDYIPKPYDPDELRARISVGRRVLNLQTELLEREKFEGVIEMAGAACHELNQPLQIMCGLLELLMMESQEADPIYKKLEEIKAAADRIAVLTGKMMGITKYHAKDYLGGKSRIVDIEKSSRLDDELREMEIRSI